MRRWNTTNRFYTSFCKSHPQIPQAEAKRENHFQGGSPMDAGAPAPKRLALLIPHTDTTLETDLQRSLTPNWIVHTARMWLDEVGEAAEKRMVDEALPQAIHTLQGINRFDYAVFGCTSASAVYGRPGVTRIEYQLSEALSCPAVTAFGAVLGEMEQRGNPSVALLTPYTPEVNGFMEKSLAQFGIHTVYMDGLGLAADPDIAGVSPEQLLSFVCSRREAIQQAGLLFLSCTNLRALELRDTIAAELNMDVITSNHSILNRIRGGKL